MYLQHCEYDLLPLVNQAHKRRHRRITLEWDFHLQNKCTTLTQRCILCWIVWEGILFWKPLPENLSLIHVVWHQSRRTGILSLHSALCVCEPTVRVCACVCVKRLSEWACVYMRVCVNTARSAHVRSEGQVWLQQKLPGWIVLGDRSDEEMAAESTRRFTKNLLKPGSAAEIRQTACNAVRHSAVTVSSRPAWIVKTWW